MTYGISGFTALPDPGFSNPVLIVLIIVVVLVILLALAFAAAAVIFRLLNNFKMRKRSSLEKKWEPLLLQILTEHETDPSLWQKLDYKSLRDNIGPEYRLWNSVDKNDEMFFIHYLQRFSVRFRNREKAILYLLARPYLGTVAGKLKHKTPSVRAGALYTLSLMGRKEFHDLFKESLGDDSHFVRIIAVKALSLPEFSKDAGLALEKAAEIENWSAQAIALMLSEFGAGALNSFRLAYGDGTRGERERIIAGMTLTLLKDFYSADIAAGILSKMGWISDMVLAEKEKDIILQSELADVSLRLLGISGRKEHLPVIRKSASSHNPVVRTNAIRTLGNLSKEQEDIDILTARLGDKSHWVAINAMWALKKAGAADIIKKLDKEGGDYSVLARQVLAEEDD